MVYSGKNVAHTNNTVYHVGFYIVLCEGTMYHLVKVFTESVMYSMSKLITDSTV